MRYLFFILVFLFILESSANKKVIVWGDIHFGQIDSLTQTLALMKKAKVTVIGIVSEPEENQSFLSRIRSAWKIGGKEWKKKIEKSYQASKEYFTKDNRSFGAFL